MKNFICISTILCSFLFCDATVNAQTIILKKAPANVQIDGVASEWLGYDETSNDKAKVSYTLSYDNNNLYLVLKTKDRKKQQDILGAGLTFSVDVKGKKRDGFSITFPTGDQDNLEEYQMYDGDKLASKVKETPLRGVHDSRD